MFRVYPIFLTALLLVAAGCDKSPGTIPWQTRTHAEPTNRQIFQVHGIVIAVEPEENSVRIRHEEIPDYMPAMTMPFDVKDTNELAGLEPGHPVSFRMTVTDTDGWIDQIRIIGPKTNTPPTTGPFRLVREVEPLEVGDPLPEYHFTNQLARTFSTADFKGQALAINFIFTRCPYPTFCPLMAANFRAAQDKLLATQNGPTNWHLLTISFDPEFDTPAVLKRYAETQRYNPTRWTFATGALIDITAIAEQFGEVFWRDEAGGFNHNLRTVVIDAAGRVQTILPRNEWTPDELVQEIVRAAAKQPPAPAPQ